MTDRAEKIMRDAAHAQVLLEDPMIAGAFANLEAQLLQAWRDSPTADSCGRERAWMLLKLLDRLKSEFQHYIAEGKIERARLMAEEAARNA